MKTLFTSVALLCFATASFAQIPNASFENWTSQGSYNNPDEWSCLNDMTSIMSVYTCTKGTPGNPGASYIKLVSKTAGGMGIIPAMAVSGEINPTTFEPSSGFPYSQRPEKLSGKWQYMAYGNGVGYISVYLTKWNTNTNSRDVISSTKYDLPGMVMSWAAFDITLDYTSSETPDSCLIILSASDPGNPAENDYLYVDGLAFTGGTVGVKENTLDANLSVYPNPATGDFVTLKWEGQPVSITSIEVFDLYGRLVKQLPVEQTNNGASISVADLAAGHYVLKGIAKEGVVVSHVVKQ